MRRRVVAMLLTSACVAWPAAAQARQAHVTGGLVAGLQMDDGSAIYY